MPVATRAPYIASNISPQATVTRTRHSTSTNRNTMGNGSLGMRWSLDDKTYFNIGGNFSKSKSDNTSDSQQSTSSEGDERINSITRNSDSKSDSHSFSVNADITRVFNDKGTSISLTGSYSDSKSTNESHSLSETTYYQLESSLGWRFRALSQPIPALPLHQSCLFRRHQLDATIGRELAPATRLSLYCQPTGERQDYLRERSISRQFEQLYPESDSFPRTQPLFQL